MARDKPRLGAFNGLTMQLNKDHQTLRHNDPAIREPRPPMVLSSYPARFSGISCFIGQRSCQKYLFGVEPVSDRWTFPLVAQVLKLEWDKAASYPACQV